MPCLTCVLMSDNELSSKPCACVLISMPGDDEWPYGVVERASDWGSGMLDLNGCFHWLLESFAVFYGRKVEKQI